MQSDIVTPAAVYEVFSVSIFDGEYGRKELYHIHNPHFQLQNKSLRYNPPPLKKNKVSTFEMNLHRADFLFPGVQSLSMSDFPRAPKVHG